MYWIYMYINTAENKYLWTKLVNQQTNSSKLKLQGTNWGHIEV